MDKTRQKELKELYKNARPVMGIVRITARPTRQVFLGYLADTRGGANSLLARLSAGLYRGRKNAALQDAFDACGGEMDIEVVDTLDYDKDSQKTDYSEELNLLLEDWLAKTPGAGRFTR